MQVAERGLAQTSAADLSRLPGQLDLARWLRDMAQAVGKHPLALHAAEEAFLDDCEMVDYQALQTLAGEAWPTIREKVLKRMAQEKNGWPGTDKKIAIYLYEGQVAQAIELADQNRYLSRSMLRSVMQAAMENHPDWVIQRSRAEAEEIMDAGRSNAYDTAAEWLALTRSGHLSAGQQSEWAALLASLIQKHAKKYKLKPLLERLR